MFKRKDAECSVAISQSWLITFHWQEENRIQLSWIKRTNICVEIDRMLFSHDENRPMMKVR